MLTSQTLWAFHPEVMAKVIFKSGLYEDEDNILKSKVCGWHWMLFLQITNMEYATTDLSTACENTLGLQSSRSLGIRPELTWIYF